MRQLRHRHQRGSTLLAVLLILLMITGVVVGFLSSVQVERATVSSYVERYRAATLASAGIENVIATLGKETSQRIQIVRADGTVQTCFRHFVTQPGALVVPTWPTGAGEDVLTQFQLRKVVELSSGRAASNLPEGSFFAPPNLNIRTFANETTPSLLLNDQPDARGLPLSMRVKWIYVRQNTRGDAGRPSNWTEEEDGSETPDVNAARPIIGRYAFWVDDESSKVNYNTAWKRDPGPNPSAHSNPSRPSHPSCVNLMGLRFPDGTYATETAVDALFRWRDRSPNRPFNSFADARQADASLVSLLEFNKFDVTHYNHDPDTTFFGEGRILLTTRRELVPKIDGVYLKDFFDILRDDVAAESLDPGLRDDIAGGQQDWRAGANGTTVLPNKFDAVVKKLVRYLSAQNWPFAPGASFQAKYYPDERPGDPRIAQIAVNIIDYVRCKESRQAVVAPLHYGMDDQGRYTLHASYAFGERSCQGVSRAPLITEMALQVNPVPVLMPAGATATPADWPRIGGTSQPKPLYICTFKVELHLPADYNVPDPGVNLVPVRTLPFPANSQRCWFVNLHETHATGRVYYVQSPTATKPFLPVSTQPNRALPLVNGEVTGKNGTTLRPGGYVTVTKVLYREESPLAAPEAELRCALYQGTSGATGLLSGAEAQWPCFGVAPHRAPVIYTLGDGATGTAATMNSVEVDDPRANVSAADWGPAKNGSNTFGEGSSRSTLGTMAPSATTVPPPPPQQDADAEGRLSDASSYMPPPNGTGSNNDAGDNGLVTSVGELGYVNTGVDAAASSMPWRTLRLQPNQRTNTQELPDWALLDLFAVVPTSSGKVKEPDATFRPHGTSVGGRVNINSLVTPFESLERTSALRAALTGARALRTPEDAAQIALNLYRHVLADGINPGKHYGHPWPDDPLAGFSGVNVYDTTGEICEIKGMSDEGEKSEALVREVVGLFTTRGAVFSIYTVGQAIKQSRSGRLEVTAEQRRHTLVERVLDGKGTAATDDDEVRFQVLYGRDLGP